ncbi:MAG: hypothetical protein GX181_10245 [Synergistaceae bacterium]|nr:hypothetical protein [Synergistaceae bacterium]
MKSIRKTLSDVVLLAAISMLILSGTCRADASASVNISRMIQECPSFSDYPGEDGVIWLRDVKYSLAADGAMRRDSLYVILARRGIDESWTRWSLPSGEDGEGAEILEAAIYDPGTGRMLAPVLPRLADMDGVKVAEVHFPDIQDEYLVLLSYREVFKKRLSVDDLVWVNDSLPVWELLVTVDVPPGSELAISARGAGDLVRESVGAKERYSWHLVNNLPWTSRTLRGDARSYLAFSTRKGTEPLARMLMSLESSLAPSPHPSIAHLVPQKNRLKTGSSLISWVNSAPSLHGSALSSVVRPIIPEEGPWSDWEKVLILNSWLRKAGWQSTVHWLTAHPLDDETPVTIGSILRPVLELNLEGTSPFFLDLGQGYSRNETPPSLWGKHIYTASGNRLNGRVVSGSSASEHRLSIEWHLELDADGEASGYVDILARNGWSAFMFPGDGPSTETIRRAAEELFWGLPVEADVAAVASKPIKYGHQLSMPVRLRNSIVSGGALLFMFPGSAPSWLEELGRWSEDYRLDFPFVVEQSLSLKLPSRSQVVMAPVKVERVMERVTYEESVFYNKKRGLFNAGSKIVLKTETLNEAAGRSLGEAVQRWLAWGEKNLPLRLAGQ